MQEPKIKISLVLTNYNRAKLLFDGISGVVMDERLDEIVISDDCSAWDKYNSMVWYFKDLPKVKIYRNEQNIDCYKNKAKALELAVNDWCILFDSDNIIDTKYIDRIENLWQAGLNERTAYMPSHANPHFDFTPVEGQTINRTNVSRLIDNPRVETMLNAMNYFVNRHEYLKVFDPATKPGNADSIYQNYRWFKLGNSMYVVPDLYYHHRVDNHGSEEASHYVKNISTTNKEFYERVKANLKSLR